MNKSTEIKRIQESIKEIGSCINNIKEKGNNLEYLDVEKLHYYSMNFKEKAEEFREITQEISEKIGE